MYFVCVCVYLNFFFVFFFWLYLSDVNWSMGYSLMHERIRIWLLHYMLLNSASKYIKFRAPQIMLYYTLEWVFIFFIFVLYIFPILISSNFGWWWKNWSSRTGNGNTFFCFSGNEEREFLIEIVTFWENFKQGTNKIYVHPQ